MSEDNTDGGASFSIQDALREEPDTVFRDKSILRSDKIVDEDRIVGRDQQLSEVIRLLKSALHGETPEDMLLYGPSGTGKSLIIGAVSQQLGRIAENEGDRIVVFELNGRTTMSEDKAVWKIANGVGDSVGVDPNIPKKGISTTDKYDRLFELVNEHVDLAILILDELDLLWGKERSKSATPAFADLLYNLTRSDRIGDLDGQIAVSVLTNNAKAIEENLDSRTQSTWGPQKILFPDYDAKQIRNILEHRRDAFHEGVLSPEVIPKAAAFGAQGDGDARLAIDLVRSAGLIADRHGDNNVTLSHLQQAEDKVDQAYTLDVIETVSIQKKATLYSLALIGHYSKDDIGGVPGPVIYEVYKDTCAEESIETRSNDSVRRWLREYNTMGVVKNDTTARGRGKGVHNEYELDISPDIVIDTIAETESHFKSTNQHDDRIKRNIQQKLSRFFAT